MNGSEERLVSGCCAILFCLSVPLRLFFYHQHSAHWSGLRMGEHFVWRGVKTNNYAPYKPNKSMKTVGRKQNEGHRYLQRQQSITNMSREKRLPDYVNCINLHYKEKSSGNHVQL